MKVWIDIDRRKVVVDKKEVFLSPTEFQLFVFLWNSQDQVFSPEELQMQALGNHYDTVVTGMVRSYLYSLRRRFTRTALASAFKTKRGFGYRIQLGKIEATEQLARLDALIQKKAISKDRYHAMRNEAYTQLQVQEQQEVGEST